MLPIDAYRCLSMPICLASLNNEIRTSDKEHPPLPREAAMTVSKRSATTSTWHRLLTQCGSLEHHNVQTYIQSIRKDPGPVERLPHPSAQGSRRTGYGSGCLTKWIKVVCKELRSISESCNEKD
jgi:hypothetical protein